MHPHVSTLQQHPSFSHANIDIFTDARHAFNLGAAAPELLASVPNENPFAAGAANPEADALEEAADEVSAEAEVPNENAAPIAGLGAGEGLRPAPVGEAANDAS
jgi:hypothetical protein